MSDDPGPDCPGCLDPSRNPHHPACPLASRPTPAVTSAALYRPAGSKPATVYERLTAVAQTLGLIPETWTPERFQQLVAETVMTTPERDLDRLAVIAWPDGSVQVRVLDPDPSRTQLRLIEGGADVPRGTKRTRLSGD